MCLCIPSNRLFGKRLQCANSVHFFAREREIEPKLGVRRERTRAAAEAAGRVDREMAERECNWKMLGASVARSPRW